MEKGKVNISKVSCEDGTKIKLPKKVTCQSLFKNHEKRLYKRTFHRTSQSLLVYFQTQCLILTHSGKMQYDKEKLPLLFFVKNSQGQRKNLSEKKKCMQKRKKIKDHMEASCKSLPIHTFLRGDRPTQEMANDAHCTSTQKVVQVSQVFPQLASQQSPLASLSKISTHPHLQLMFLFSAYHNLICDIHIIYLVYYLSYSNMSLEGRDYCLCCSLLELLLSQNSVCHNNKQLHTYLLNE